MEKITLYNCSYEVERKMKQVNFLYQRLLKYQNKIFVNNGLDEETNCYPIEVYFNSFIIFARSIFQYAHKQAKECNKLEEYNSFISKNPIIKLFKKLRDNEIHSLAIKSSSTVFLQSPIIFSIDKKGNKKYTEYGLKKLRGEEPDHEPARVEYYILERVEIKTDLINQLTKNKQTDLLEEVRKGNALFEEIELNGEKELFNLSTQYYETLNRFIEDGKKNRFIT